MLCPSTCAFTIFREMTKEDVINLPGVNGATIIGKELFKNK